ncbi:MAG TPA: divalent metal cation transporter [Chloroflexia bacterium]|nr:divalent metal cation transporter [Chloroflexia bacterium]
MKRLASLALGILAAIGGFVDMGGIITSTQAGAQYQFALIWTLIPGVIGFAVYADMSGRVVIASGRSLFDVIRDRLGARLALIPLIASVIMQILTLFVELAGMSLALEMASQLSYLIWLPLAVLLLVIILWRVSFDLMDNSAAIMGLATLVAVVAMVKLAPDWGQVGGNIIHPQIDTSQPVAVYLFAVIGLLGAYMTPYQFYFYSSGAIEEEWGGKDLLTNRVVAIIGTSFGAIVTLALMIISGIVLFPQHASVNTLEQTAQPVQSSLGVVGLVFFLLGTFAVSLGAGLECALSGTYSVCQYMGWDWGKKGRPRTAPMYHLLYIVMLILAMAIAYTGVNPIGLTNIIMAIGAISLPFTFIPLLIVANDPEYVGDQKNNLGINIIAIIMLLLLIGVTLTALPLLILSGGGGS